MGVRTLAVAVAGAAVVLAGCGEAAGSAADGSGHVTVRVLYAGSLVNTMEHAIGPAFDRATGYDYQGYGAGSAKVAGEIRGKVRRGDVFISANPEVNATLRGQANGGWVSWYATFARSPLVLGYNPKSEFAQALETKPWYRVVTRPGFRLGRTDPKLDPKGELTVTGIRQVAHDRHRPPLAKQILANSQVFPEQDLVGRLQAGQLDAGFFYSIETHELKIPTVPLDPVHLGARYTVTVLNRATNRDGAISFVRFLLGPKGKAVLEEHGFGLVAPPAIAGDRAAVPRALRASVGAR